MVDMELAQEINSGDYNDIIKGYLIIAMKNQDFSRDEIKNALDGLREAFEFTDAEQAYNAYMDF